MTRANNLAAYAAIPPTFRNRIINGRGRVDQRFGNLGMTVGTGGYFGDRWAGQKAASGTIGASCSGGDIRWNVSVAQGAPAAADFNGFWQSIEGINIADLEWGSGGANIPVTLSFRVNSPLVGTYAVRLANSAADRSYVAPYTVNQANVWERKTITIPACSDGTWVTNSGLGFTLAWDMGSGSNFNAPANAWSNGNYTRTAACVQLGGGVRLFRITDVQLERGTVATEYEALPYDVELARCQRYCEWVPFNMNFVPTLPSQYLEVGFRFAVEKRATPTFAAIVADPLVVQTSQNNASNILQRATIHGGSVTLQAGTAAQAYVVGYRSLATAEL